MTRRAAGRGIATSPSKLHRWLLPALLLVLARNASAAGKCEGQWHFELSSMGAEAEDWLPKDSWCRSNRLPKAVDASLRYRAGGGVDQSGSPYKLADLWTGAGRCEFVFGGKASSMPEENELNIQVDDVATVTGGSGRCFHYEPRTPDGKRLGTSAAIAVKVTRSAFSPELPAQPSAQPEALVATIVRACRGKAADTLWNLMTPRFRAELDQRAASLRAALPPSELRALYGYRGRREDFSGQAFWGLMVRSRNPADNPCADADKWKVGEDGDTDGASVTVIRRPGLTSGAPFSERRIRSTFPSRWPKSSTVCASTRE
jgi:hypothetical protein